MDVGIPRGVEGPWGKIPVSTLGDDHLLPINTFHLRDNEYLNRFAVIPEIMSHLHEVNGVADFHDGEDNHIPGDDRTPGYVEGRVRLTALFGFTW